MKKYDKETEQKIISLYKTGSYTYKEIGLLFGIPRCSVGTILRRNNIRCEKSRSHQQIKYPIKEDFFDIIDTQEKAYFLGFLYADGYNNTLNNTITLSLQKTDEDTLIKISDLVYKNKPLSYIDRSNQRLKGVNQQDSCCLHITNKHISEQLVKLGCTKAKTHTLTFPTEEQVPKHLQRHFIRGYFDGDGCIVENHATFSITSTKSFLLSAQKILIENIKLNKTILSKRRKNRPSYTLTYSGVISCIKIYEYLYKDSLIHMDRKKVKFLNLKNNYRYIKNNLTGELFFTINDVINKYKIERRYLQRRLNNEIINNSDYEYYTIL